MMRDMRGLETIMEIQHLLLGHFPTVLPHQVWFGLVWRL